MNVVTLERTLPANAQRVFDMVTLPQNMIRWWGHDGMTVPEANLNFSRLGPWYAIMMTLEGRRKKVSGQVLSVDPPRAISFTWAWHNENDERGHESRVTIEITEESETQAKLILQHHGLPSDEARAGHVIGWTSIFEKLEKGLA